MILKLLLVLGVVAIVYFAFFKKKPLRNAKPSKKQKEELDSNDMVECQSCGIYAEMGDSFLSGSKYYCSQECLEKAR